MPAAVGVKADGEKVVLDLELLGSESSECSGMRFAVKALLIENRACRPQLGFDHRWEQRAESCGRSELAWDR